MAAGRHAHYISVMRGSGRRRGDPGTGRSRKADSGGKRGGRGLCRV